MRTLVEAARKRKIQTIAERVEDANTMAVLWQLGVQYIQGYFVHAPEEVVLARARRPHRSRSGRQQGARLQALDWRGQPRVSTAPRCARSPR